MGIYRGAGGTGDAINDASSETRLAVEARDAAIAAKEAAQAAKVAAELAETNAEAAETNAETAETNAETAATAAQLAETNAETAQAAAEVARNAAQLAETNAETAETNAETAETNANASAALAQDWATKTSGTVAGGEYSAKYHAQAASTSASNASTSATNASNSATAAAASATSAAASYDAFDDRYLGSKSSNPTVDNDGNALLTGALYYNTVAPEMRIWTGTDWVFIGASGTAGVNSFNTRFGDITLTSSDVTTALTYTPLAPAAIGTTVQAYDAQLVDIAGLTPTDNGVIIGNGTNFVVESNATLRTSLGLAAVASTGSTSDLTEGTKLFYTDARARTAVSFVAGSGAYNNTTGVITIPTNTNQLTNGAGFLTSASTLDATKLSGIVPGNSGVTAGSTSSSFVEYNGTTATAGQFDGGTTTPTGTTRLNYGGYIYPTAINLLGTGDTATVATNYYVETASDGFVRPKTLANVKTEIVTSAAVIAGLGYTPYNSTNPSGYTTNTGTVTSVAAGNGMTFTTITGTGTVTMGTPATLTNTTTNALTTNSHTHALTGELVETTTGSALYYGARAWVNFNGTGTVAIRTQVNVSSITDNGVGDYTVNFTTAMPDANYVVSGAAQWDGAGSMPTVEPYNNGSGTKVAPTTSAFRFVTVGSGALAQIQDSAIINISVFR